MSEQPALCCGQCDMCPLGDQWGAVAGSFVANNRELFDRLPTD